MDFANYSINNEYHFNKIIFQVFNSSHYSLNDSYIDENENLSSGQKIPDYYFINKGENRENKDIIEKCTTDYNSSHKNNCNENECKEKIEIAKKNWEHLKNKLNSRKVELLREIVKKEKMVKTQLD